jgi:hypothetical protein
VTNFFDGTCAQREKNGPRQPDTSAISGEQQAVTSEVAMRSTLHLFWADVLPHSSSVAILRVSVTHGAASRVALKSELRSP